jgi:hypothetical protein
MIICELGFEDEDINHLGYSMREVDYYSHIPYDLVMKGYKQHRLSLRKNIKENKFEVYRFFHDSEKEEVAFSGSFNDALRFADKEWNKFWGHLGKKEPDEPCQHKYPKVDTWFCPIWRGEK